MTTPIQALDRRAETHPGRIAFITGNEVWTYRQLATDSLRAAHALAARGIGSGDRVVLHMANTPELAVALLACLRIGAIASPLNTRFKTVELRSLLQRLKPAIYIGQSQFYPWVAPIESSILGLNDRFVVGSVTGVDRPRSWNDLIDSCGSPPPPRAPNPYSPALLLTTSGTTGLPKFVTHTLETISAVARAWTHFDLDDSQIAINCTSMMHGIGAFIFFACMHHGVPMLMLERFDPDTVLTAIERHRATWMLGLPFMFIAMMESQRLRRRDVGSLRHCAAGGDVCPIQVQQEFEQQFRVPLHSLWGATEAPASLTHGLQPGPVCRSIPGTQISLVDAHGVPVPRGEIGELLVRGPTVTIGYWEGPGRVVRPTIDAWYHTGDLMRQGDGDDIWFVARKKDIIIRGGSNISPMEIEQALLTHPAVKAAAAFGVPDRRLGQRVAAIVQLTADPHAFVLDDILAVARIQLADYKVPDSLTIVGEIPRNSLGKVDRDALIAIASRSPTESST